MIAILAVVAGSILSMALVSAIAISNSGANQRGTIKTIGFQVYWDKKCTNQTDTLDWGTMEPNTLKNFTVYIKNIGTIPERLTMKTSNWNPTHAQRNLMLTWNRENTILDSGSNVTATFTLKMPSTVSNLTSFSFDITITGTQRKS